MVDEEILVIRGVNEDGVKLRPGDWIERISSSLASFGSDQRLRYSPSVQPCIIKGEKCLVVARGLEQLNPEAYDFVLRFAHSNRLQLVHDRRSGERALPVMEVGS